MTESDEDRIAKRAYVLWEQEGWPEGRHQDHWQQALKEFQEGQPAVSADLTEAVPPALSPLDTANLASENLSADEKPAQSKLRSVR